MTPLEEIEQAISTAQKMFAEALTPQAMSVFAPLYQARAIERLEATVRAIGVLIQHEANERRDRGPWANAHEAVRYGPASGHVFEMGGVPLKCKHCGMRREAHI